MNAHQRENLERMALSGGLGKVPSDAIHRFLENHPKLDGSIINPFILPCLGGLGRVSLEKLKACDNQRVKDYARECVRWHQTHRRGQPWVQDLLKQINDDQKTHSPGP